MFKPWRERTSLTLMKDWCQFYHRFCSCLSSCSQPKPCLLWLHSTLDSLYSIQVLFLPLKLLSTQTLSPVTSLNPGLTGLYTGFVPASQAALNPNPVSCDFTQPWTHWTLYRFCSCLSSSSQPKPCLLWLHSTLDSLDSIQVLFLPLKLLSTQTLSPVTSLNPGLTGLYTGFVPASQAALNPNPVSCDFTQPWTHWTLYRQGDWWKIGVNSTTGFVPASQAALNPNPVSCDFTQPWTHWTLYRFCSCLSSCSQPKPCLLWLHSTLDSLDSIQVLFLPLKLLSTQTLSPVTSLNPGLTGLYTGFVPASQAALNPNPVSCDFTQPWTHWTLYRFCFLPLKLLSTQTLSPVTSLNPGLTGLYTGKETDERLKSPTWAAKDPLYPSTASQGPTPACLQQRTHHPWSSPHQTLWRHISVHLTGISQFLPPPTVNSLHSQVIPASHLRLPPPMNNSLLPRTTPSSHKRLTPPTNFSMYDSLPPTAVGANGPPVVFKFWNILSLSNLLRFFDGPSYLWK